MGSNSMSVPALPLISVIAVCHNHGPYVIQTLDSIRNQTYPNIELIIINNRKDECEGIIRNWIAEQNVKCTFIQNEQAKSITANLNYGLNHVSGVYFQGISCDDVLIKEKIEGQEIAFRNLNPDYAMSLIPI